MQQQDQTKQNHYGQGAEDYLDLYLTEMLEVIHGQAAGECHPLQRHPWLPGTGIEVGTTPEVHAPPSSSK
jgi:hypothetical protein